MQVFCAWRKVKTCQLVKPILLAGLGRQVPRLSQDLFSRAESSVQAPVTQGCLGGWLHSQLSWVPHRGLSPQLAEQGGRGLPSWIQRWREIRSVCTFRLPFQRLDVPRCCRYCTVLSWPFSGELAFLDWSTSTCRAGHEAQGQGHGPPPRLIPQTHPTGLPSRPRPPFSWSPFFSYRMMSSLYLWAFFSTCSLSSMWQWLFSRRSRGATRATFVCRGGRTSAEVLPGDPARPQPGLLPAERPGI